MEEELRRTGSDRLKRAPGRAGWCAAPLPLCALKRPAVARSLCACQLDLITPQLSWSAANENVKEPDQYLLAARDETDSGSKLSSYIPVSNRVKMPSPSILLACKGRLRSNSPVISGLNGR